MQTSQVQLLLLVPMIPLCGAIVVYLLCNSSAQLHKFSGWVATIASFLSFSIVVSLFLHLQTNPQPIVATAWSWFSVPPLNVDLALRLDALSAVMTLIVTGVGSLIHLYAIGYMAEDEDRPRFFAYLNLFLFAMLLLVLGDNLIVMFVGWEGVGVCSYLLIGFWHRAMPNAVAGQKAFVVNRIGDAGFLLGVFTLFWAGGSINIVALEQLVTANTISVQVIEIAAILLFIGACGKSAQIPLYIWLPDAMAGPTPVSALIHAATMVTAGVYLIARLSFLFVQAPIALLLILIIGTLTALLAATIALVQNDIKRVLAYSTVSQLGYMFMAMGSGAFSNGIFHVVTHAFFKACLFMAAGSVIMGCHHEQDMRNFGGLAKKMPVTFLTYFIATLAIAGFPFLSGFYSKDMILWSVFSNTAPLTVGFTVFGISVNRICWAIGLFTAFLTAFYMTRSLVMTFFGKYRGHAHPHESPWVVTLPLIVLAFFSLVFGFLWGENLLEYLAAWTREDIRAGHEALAHQPLYHTLEYASIAVALGGILLAYLMYAILVNWPQRLAQSFSGLYRALCQKWWVDELYAGIVIRPLAGFSNFLFRGIDRMIIDASVNGTGLVVQASGELIRKLHTGRISSYALVMFLGAFFMISFYLVLR